MDEKRQILQGDYDIPMTQTLESEVSVMYNLSKGIEDCGIAQGITSGTTAAIKNLTKNTGWSIERAMETLGISESDRPKYMQMLQSM